MSVKKNLSFIVLLIVVSVAAMFWDANSSFAPSVSSSPIAVRSPISSESPYAEATAMLDVLSGTRVILDDAIVVHATSTVFSVLQSAVASSDIPFAYKDYPGMGYLVTKIGDTANGSSGAYWQYWLNGTYARVSADHARVHEGDTIEWKFTSSQQ